MTHPQDTTPANPAQVISEEQRLAAIYTYTSVAGDCNINALVAALTAAIGPGQQAVDALHNAREFIENSAFNVPTKDYFDAVLKEIDTALTAALSAAPAGGEWRPTHRHVKTGREYRLDDYAEIQTRNPLTDYDKVAIYRDQSGKTWVRPVGEFNDGRFETLPASPAKEGRS